MTSPKPTVLQAEAPLDLGDEAGDELLLDSDDILTSPVGAPPIAPPKSEDDETTRPKVARDTGTLFERMSNIARGAAKAQVDEEGQGSAGERDPLDLPRFLNRQNNQ